MEKLKTNLKETAENAKNSVKKKLLEKRGMGTVEVVLIIVVLVALVIVFKDQISGLVQTIFGHINSSVKEVY